MTPTVGLNLNYKAKKQHVFRHFMLKNPETLENSES